MNQTAPFSATRKTQRFAPQRPVTVAISKNGESVAYGVVTNISEGGACLQASAVPRHPNLEFVMSFYDREYVQTTGRIVWSELEEGLATFGVEFTGLSDHARESLRADFRSGAFTPLVASGE